VFLQKPKEKEEAPYRFVFVENVNASPILNPRAANVSRAFVDNIDGGKLFLFFIDETTGRHKLHEVSFS